MKIRINKTGEIINANHVIELGVGRYRIDTIRNNGLWTLELNENDFVFIGEQDWDYLRIQFASLAMIGMLSGERSHFSDSDERKSWDIIAEDAVMAADALIEQLKR